MNIITIPLRRFMRQSALRFEYDPNKSAANLEKHGIDFEKAQELWTGKIVKVAQHGDYGERRYALFGIIDGKHWTVIVTYRGPCIRIISARRSRAKEAAYYDAKKD